MKKLHGCIFLKRELPTVRSEQSCKVQSYVEETAYVIIHWDFYFLYHLFFLLGTLNGKKKTENKAVS